MSRPLRGSGPLARLWRFFIETSEVAVAVHYHAPWYRAPFPRT